MFDPMIFSVVEERQNAILEEARKQQLISLASAARPCRWRRFFARAGDILIAAGSSLQQVVEPADCPDGEAMPLCC